MVEVHLDLAADARRNSPSCCTDDWSLSARFGSTHALLSGQLLVDEDRYCGEHERDD